MKNTITITQNKIELISAWGSQEVEVSATATITQDGNSENYEIKFRRNQITGYVSRVDVTPREENTTTENTLCSETVSDLCYDELNN